MSLPPQHHLPHEINATTMVIRSERGHGRVVLDAFLTTLAWIAFIYLFGQGLWLVTTQRANGLEMPWFSHIVPTLSDLSVYLLAMAIQASILLIWARYNYWRFRGKQRRAPLIALPENQLQNDYGVHPQRLQALRTLPISVIHHAHDGSITHIESSQHAPVDPKNVATSINEPGNH